MRCNSQCGYQIKIAFMDSGEIAFLQTPSELRNNDDPRIRRFINNEILRNDFVI